MTVTDFIDKTRKIYRDHGTSGLRYSLEEMFQGFLVRSGVFYNYGIDFLDEEWDLLVLLDACRADLMRDVAPAYDFIDVVDTRTSCASHSREWIHKTFMENGDTLPEKLRTQFEILKDPDNNETYAQRFGTKDCSDLTYVTWNHFSRLLDGESFELLDEVWKYGWDDNRKVVEPRYVTDRAIEVGRTRDPDRMILHYMQPHTPFKKQVEDRQKEVTSPEDTDVGDVFKDEENGMGENMSPFTRVQRGFTSYDDLWDMYVENLEWVLDDVEILLENIDAERVVISADHGNAIGEWGCYGHRPYTPVRGAKEVPWVETSAHDEGTYEPEVQRRTADLDNDTVRKRLADLGYV